MDIIPLIKDIKFNQAIWGLPILYIIHFFEELPRFADWATEYLGKPYTKSKFIAENIVLWMLLTVSVLMTLYMPGKAGIILVLSAAAGFFLNMIFHVFFTLKTGIYSPGTVTACLFFTPVSLFIFYLAGREGLLSLTTFILSIVLGLAILPVVITIVHNVIDRGISFKTLIKKIVMFMLLPFFTVSVAMILFGRETVNTFMIYTSPVILLPLFFKILKIFREKKKSNTTL